MGINLSGIVTLEPRKLEDFSGKVLAIDAFNTLYQFLAIIRQPNGTPLMDRQGRITSHLSGLIYRLSNFVEAGIKPVFVFDGEPPRLKARTIQSRGEIKRRAEREWREAVEIGTSRRADEGDADVPSHRRHDRSIEATPRSLGSRSFSTGGRRGSGERDGPKRDRVCGGVAGLRRPPVRLPASREEPRDQRPAKAPAKEVFVEVRPEEISLEARSRTWHYARGAGRHGPLIGTDFNEGVRGIGPKKALALIKKHGSLQGALSELGVDIESKDEVRKIFLFPNVTRSRGGLVPHREASERQSAVRSAPRESNSHTASSGLRRVRIANMTST